MKQDAEQTLYNNTQINKFISSVAVMRGQLEAQLEYGAMKATLLHKRYTSLIAKGFTPEQALILCKGN